MRIFLLLTLATLPAVADPISPAYPDSRRTDHTDTLHGVPVPDPYRWLEDDHSPETTAWVEAQNKVTAAYLATIPERAQIEKRLTEIWNVERFSTPSKEGNRYFYSRNDGLQNQAVVYTLDKLDGEPRLLLDPNTLSEDGTVSLADYEISEDGAFMAYSISHSGSDWREWKVRDVAKGTDYPDHLLWSKFSGASWSKDNKGFYYSRYDAPKKGEEFKAENYFQKVYYHRLGTPQEKDELIYERPDHDKWGLNAWPSEDGAYLLIHVRQGTDSNNAFFYKSLTEKDAPVVELLKDFDASYDFIHNVGSLFYFQTNLDAPRGRVLAIDLAKPEREHWKEVLPEAQTATLDEISVIGNRFVANYMTDARSDIRFFNLDGTPAGTLNLPDTGSAYGFRGKSTDMEAFYSFSTYTSPPVSYRYDFTNGKSTIVQSPKLKFDPTKFQTEIRRAKSKEGTEVQLFIVSKKDLPRDGQNPTLLYGYGGFNISLQPYYSPATISWIEMGGLYVVATLRGGVEYGEDWHKAGMKTNKQNVFDDFIAAAEFLISENYTSSKKLAIAGGSNGGLLVGACMTQRPKLFAAALPAVGVMDMLRFHKWTIGWGWIPEYGNPDDSGEFKALHAYSPYHNLKPGIRYPSTLVQTADHDDRVFPAHSFKFAAALQHAHKGGNPVLIRIESKAGHGAGTPTSKRIEEIADKWAFLVRELHMTLP